MIFLGLHLTVDLESFGYLLIIPAIKRFPVNYSVIQCGSYMISQLI